MVSDLDKLLEKQEDIKIVDFTKSRRKCHLCVKMPVCLVYQNMVQMLKTFNEGEDPYLNSESLNLMSKLAESCEHFLDVKILDLYQGEK